MISHAKADGIFAQQTREDFTGTIERPIIIRTGDHNAPTTAALAKRLQDIGVQDTSPRQPTPTILAKQPQNRSAYMNNPANLPLPLTPEEIHIAHRLKSMMTSYQIMETLNERIQLHRLKTGTPHTLEQIEAVNQNYGTEIRDPNNWNRLRKALDNATETGIIDQITPAVINAFAIIFAISPKQKATIRETLKNRNGKNGP